MASGAPVRKYQPSGLAPSVSAYCFSTSGVSRWGSTVIETKTMSLPKRIAEHILHLRHLVGEQGTGIGAGCKDESDGHHLAAKIAERTVTPFARSG